MGLDQFYSTSTKKEKEILSFDQQASQWWDENGPFKLLHRMNPLRLHYITSHLKKYFNLQENREPLKGLKILDVGCGGGTLCEPLARLGATVTGIDASKNAIEVATLHANEMGLSIDYQCLAPEEIQNETFDCVIALEIIEHVSDVRRFIETCCTLTKGPLFLSTLNRTPSSFLGAIVGAEYLLRWVPKGTHQWDQFIKPSELAQHLRTQDFHLKDIQGMSYNPIFKKWSFSTEPAINYISMATR